MEWGSSYIDGCGIRAGGGAQSRRMGACIKGSYKRNRASRRSSALGRHGIDEIERTDHRGGFPRGATISGKITPAGRRNWPTRYRRSLINAPYGGFCISFLPFRALRRYYFRAFLKKLALPRWLRFAAVAYFLAMFSLFLFCVQVWVFT